MLVVQFLQSANQIFSAGLVVISAAMLLYNLPRGWSNGVIRAANILLGGVTLVFLGDVVLAMGPASLNVWLRLQWIGIALVPAALFHLSHALLATTGRASRGRRTLGMGLLYLLGMAFMVAAAGTDQIVRSARPAPVPHLKAGPWFPVYLFYAASASLLALLNVARARRRCLTHFTRRRMSYMLYSILTPMVGIFPYTLLMSEVPAEGGFWLVVSLSNAGMLLMLSFMAYPLSFFGNEAPDRVIKAELLEFFLRGPFAGVITLSVIIGLPQAGRVLGMPGDEFMPLAAVAVLIFLQWAIGRVLPGLKDRLIYGPDRDEMRQLRAMAGRLLTRSDIDQLLEGILASACDYLQVSTAFAASYTPEGPVLEQAIGDTGAVAAVLESDTLAGMLEEYAQDSPQAPVVCGDFWLIPLRNGHQSENNHRSLFGVMGIQARPPQASLTQAETRILGQLARQMAHALRDVRIQAEILGRLEALMPEVEAIEQLRWTTRYRGEPGETAESIVGAPDFETKVKDALSHYWGGPRLTQSELLNLKRVQISLPAHDHDPVKALRAILSEGIERLRPEGERTMTAAEWTLYNILELRFIQGRKVRDVSRRLAMSESDFYRKQRVAVSELARTLTEMEQYGAQSKESDNSTLVHPKTLDKSL